MKRPFQKFLAAQHGNVLMLTGLSIVVLVAIAGAGFDFGRQQLVRMKLQNASDAAAIAAASMQKGTPEIQRRNVAQRYFNLNYPETYLGVARPTPIITIGDTISVDATTEMDANFVSNVGVPKMGAQGRTVVNATQNQDSVYDVIMVLDNSNSMSYGATAPAFTDTPQGERQVARNLINLKCQADQRAMCERTSRYPASFYIADGSIVTYNNANQCRANYANLFCNNISNGPNVGNGYGYSFFGQTRLNALRAVAHNFVRQILQEGADGSRVGLIRWGSEVLEARPLSEDALAMTQAINRMAGWGATNPVSAMQQAVQLSTSYNPRHIKALVFMTDGFPTATEPLGNNATDSTGCNGSGFCQPAINQTLPICTQLKNSGVQIYSIAFGIGPSASMTLAQANQAKAFLSSCASVDEKGAARFYDAPDGKTLDEAFSDILVQLGKIRISE